MAAVALGVGLLVLGVVGYGLGWNDTGGVRYHSNVVPLSFAAGAASLFVGVTLLLARRPDSLPSHPTTVPVVTLALVAWVFVVSYLAYVGPVISVRADLVMGSESQFVDHIIRYRVGQPQYTPGEDANTSAYTPGAPLLTYFVASAFGYPTSIPAYRLVQQLYLLLAVFFAAAAARELFRAARPTSPLANRWLLFWIPFLYLLANNPHTNAYTHVLYSDGLALPVNALAFWLMVKHCTSGNDRWLLPMAVLPAIGFLVKQKEVSWAGLYVVYLLLAGRVSVRRILVFGVTSLALAGLVVGTCYALWGYAFYFWTFEILRALHISLREVLEQVADSGGYTLLGLFGGAVLLRGEGFRRFVPLWACWPLQVLMAAYTSGLAFRPAHFGAATLIGAVWFVVALSTVWPAEGEGEVWQRPTLWFRTAAVSGMVFLFLLSTGHLRLGARVPPGMERYLAAIEQEFEGLPPERVLLDTGSWVYLADNVVMKDRESPIGTLWGTGTSDFAATIRRIQEHTYDKILVRKLKGSPLYTSGWEGDYLYRDERIQNALREHYQEVRVIPSPGIPTEWLYPPLLYDISVLVPSGSIPASSGEETRTPGSQASKQEAPPKSDD